MHVHFLAIVVFRTVLMTIVLNACTCKTSSSAARANTALWSFTLIMCYKTPILKSQMRSLHHTSHIGEHFTLFCNWEELYTYTYAQSVSLTDYHHVILVTL